MKRNLCLMFAIILILSVLTACSPKTELTDVLWYSRGSIVGLEDQASYYDVHITFNKDNTGSVQNIYEDNSNETYEFEYSAFNGYITFISYDGEVLDKGKHTYPYSIENDVLTINVNNKKLEFKKLTSVSAQKVNPDHSYEVLQNEYDRILEYMQLAYSGDLITTIYIDHSDSKIVVGLKELNDENISFFKEYISDADFIVFEEGGNIVLTTE